MQNSRSRWKNAFMLWSRSGSAQSVRKTGWSAAISGNWNASPGRQSAPDGPAERSEAHTQSDSNDGPSVLDVTAAGVTGVVVLMARVMQAASFLLMAGITWANAKAFRYGGDALGYIGTMITEENYGLGLYVGIGVFLVLMGAIWCLWILSGKHAGGKVRLQKYDTGRGFIPFIIILVLVLAAGPAAYLMPKNAGSLQPIVDGGYAALEAWQRPNTAFLLFCSIGGASLSFIRKMLLV